MDYLVGFSMVRSRWVDIPEAYLMIELACSRIICACYITWDGVNYRIVGVNWDIGIEVLNLDARRQRSYFCYGL